MFTTNVEYITKYMHEGHATVTEIVRCDTDFDLDNGVAKPCKCQFQDGLLESTGKYAEISYKYSFSYDWSNGVVPVEKKIVFNIETNCDNLIELTKLFERQFIGNKHEVVENVRDFILSDFYNDEHLDYTGNKEFIFNRED